MLSIGGTVDIRSAGGFLPGRMGGGSVHHVAFRAKDDADQAEMVKKLAENHGIADHGAEGPQLLPVRLLPRAGRHPLRDRHRRAGFCGGRTAGQPGRGLEASGFPGGSAQRDRGAPAGTGISRLALSPLRERVTCKAGRERGGIHSITCPLPAHFRSPPSPAEGRGKRGTHDRTVLHPPLSNPPRIRSAPLSCCFTAPAATRTTCWVSAA